MNCPVVGIALSCKIAFVSLQDKHALEPTEAQYLILNALDTLELLQYCFYDRETGIWYIRTPNPILPFAKLLQNGDIVPSTWISEL